MMDGRLGEWYINLCYVKHMEDAFFLHFDHILHILWLFLFYISFTLIGPLAQDLY